MDGNLLPDEDLFLMTNVHPKRTGLPFVVYISEKGGARHDARVKVAAAEGPPNWKAVVSVRPSVAVLEGALSGRELAALTAWVELNRETIVLHWAGGFDDSADVIAALKPIA
jgi:hypothetical protein